MVSFTGETVGELEGQTQGCCVMLLDSARGLR